MNENRMNRLIELGVATVMCLVVTVTVAIPILSGLW